MDYLIVDMQLYAKVSRKGDKPWNFADSFSRKRYRLKSEKSLRTQLLPATCAKFQAKVVAY